MIDKEDAEIPRTQLMVVEYAGGDFFIRCLLCGDEADPVANPPWHGQHIRTCHPQYTTWARLIPDFDEWTDET